MLNAESVARAIEGAHRRHARTVIEAALSMVSAKDMAFLYAMAKDDGPSTSGDIGHRLGARSNLVANYRTRLMTSGLIESVGYGKVDFAIPGLRCYLSSRTTH